MFIATFHTHFGAQQFHKQQKKIDPSAMLMPVPRALSAACGICVSFEVDNVAEFVANHPEDIEGIYLSEGTEFKKLFEAPEE